MSHKNKIIYPKLKREDIKLFQKINNQTYVEVAEEVEKWIRNYEFNKGKGKSWPLSSGEGSSEGDVVAATLTDRTLYSGAAGIGFFYVQLYEVTGKEEYLNKALEAFDYLSDTFTPELGKKPGVHSGLSGEGVFALLLYKKTGEQKYLDYAIQVGDAVYEYAVKEDGKTHWYGLIDYMGDGSTVAYWIQLAQITGNQKYLAYAKETLDYMISLVVENEDDTVNWNFLEIHNYFPDLPEGGLISNFAHGTAGVVYLLAKYYQAAKDEYYLDYAKKGFRFLENIAVRDEKENSAIVPYIYWKNTGDVYDVFYLSMCHGPVGDGIVAKQLYEVTQDKHYLEFYDQLTNALIEAGVPNKRSAGYWNDCICCGSSGVLLHFIDGITTIGDEKYERLAKETAIKLIGDAFKDDKGVRWYNAWTRLIPWNVDAHLGLYMGATGSASALLSLYGKLENVAVTPIFEY